MNGHERDEGHESIELIIRTACERIVGGLFLRVGGCGAGGASIFDRRLNNVDQYWLNWYITHYGAEDSHPVSPPQAQVALPGAVFQHPHTQKEWLW